MEKRKLTLSIRKDLFDEVKKYAKNEGINLSSIVEEYFEYLVLEKWIDELLAKKDYIQASEKLWSAAALMVKAVAASRGITILSHGELFSFVRKLGEEENKPELRRLFSVANTLHQNFYENWLH